MRAKEATILEQKLALLQIPYLKHLELSQIEFWEKNFTDDLDLLFDLYVSQGIITLKLKRNKSTSSIIIFALLLFGVFFLIIVIAS